MVQKRTLAAPRIRVLIPDAGCVLMLPVARALAQSGVIDTWLLVGDRPTPGWQTRHKHAVLRRQSPSFIEDVHRALAISQADVLLPVSEEGIREISSHRSALEGRVRLPLMASPEILDLAGDKGLLALFAERRNLPIPRTVVHDFSGQSSGDASALKFPVMAKPVRGTGGIGIERLNDSTALKAFFVRHRDGGRWVIQEYIRGRDVGCSVMCSGGQILAHTVQRDIRPLSTAPENKNGVEFVADREVLSLVSTVVAKLRFDGVAHFDLRHDADNGGIKLLEINPRFWGSLLGSVHAGANFALLMVAAALNQPLDTPTVRTCRYFRAPLALRLGFSSLRGFFNLPRMLRSSDLSFRLRDPYPDAARFLARNGFGSNARAADDAGLRAGQG